MLKSRKPIVPKPGQHAAIDPHRIPGRNTLMAESAGEQTLMPRSISQRKPPVNDALTEFTQIRTRLPKVSSSVHRPNDRANEAGDGSRFEHDLVSPRSQLNWIQRSL